MTTLAHDWQVDGNFAEERDPSLRRRVVVCRGTVEARAEVTGAEACFSLRLAETGSGCRLAVANVELTLTETEGDIRIGIGEETLTYDLRAYDVILPTWSDEVRRPIERDMAGLPLATEKWLRLRIHAGERVRVWVDDRLLVDRAAKHHAGLRLTLDAGARLAVEPLRPLPAETPGFEPIALDGYARDRKLAGGRAVAESALPFGRLARLFGIPFLFPERKKGGPDHLNVGRSLCRQGAMEGYLPTFGPRYAGSLTVDPARIQLRIPNGRYDALYVIAGFAPGPHKVPTLSAAFYRPGAGFAQCFATAVKALDAQGDGAVPITLEDGSKQSLWLVKISLDPAKLGSFSDMETLELELTSEIRQYRSYPDPFLYGWHGAGRPSGVHIYAVTLHRPAVELTLEPAVFGHVWTAPDVPRYEIALNNHAAEDMTVALTVRTTSYDGREMHEEQHNVVIPAAGRVTKTIDFPVEKNGLHKLEVSWERGPGGPRSQETRTFCRLAPDTRAPHWSEGDGPLFGYWSYHGGHYTPPGAEIMRVMHAAGARTSVKLNNDPNTPAGKLLQEYRWPASSSAWPVKPQWEWAGEDSVDPQKYAAYQREVIEEIRKVQGDHPDFVTFFPEPHISRELGAGAPADYYGEKFELTAQAQLAFRVFWNTAKAAAEAVRREWPNTKILIPWGDPLFIVPFLRAGFPRKLLDGCGLDMIGFERLPEQQVFEQSNHRLWVLREEFRRAGYDKPELYYIEGVFVPTEAGGATWEEQAERYHRWTLLSLANGVERFYSGWFAFDCGDWYGAEHYGGCGIQRRIPYCDPKPAYAHFATMTRLLERTRFVRYVPTGSHGVYCLEFERLETVHPSGTVPAERNRSRASTGTVPSSIVALAEGREPTAPQEGRDSPLRSIYVLWTVRGTRPVTLAVTNVEFTIVDSMDNGVAVQAGTPITVGTSPVYLVGAGEVTGITLGEPDHSDAVAWSRGRNRETWHDGPIPSLDTTIERTLSSLAKWRLGGPDETFEHHNYDDKRFFGNMSLHITGDTERDGRFLAVRMGEQPAVRPLASWYAALEPPKPLKIPGKACALGIWVKAHSDWSRLAFLLRDASGERWLSCGMKDVCNANELHGWLTCGFDGWRYLRMELPANSEYDRFREFGSTWWGSTGGTGQVDLPLTVEKIFVMRRTHVVYVNDLQPADPADLLLGELIAEYDSPFDATPGAVKLNRVRMPLPRAAAGARNPIREMEDNPLPAVTLLGVRNPDWGYDGTVCHVDFTEAPGAAEYQVWVAAYPDGRGAVPLAMMPASGGLLRNLRPGRALHLWVTYTAEGGTSRPSNPLSIELVDAFVRK
jgi:hypothetical protein